MKFIEFILDDPKQGNSFGLEQANKLTSILDRCIEENKPLLMRAKGKLFCAGGNVKEYAKLNSGKEGIQINKEIRQSLNKLVTLPLPTVVLVHGDCFGGGIEVLSAFDHIIATSEAKFGFWQRKIGLLYGWGGQKRIAERVGMAKVKKLLLEAQTLSAQEAQDLGLIDEVVIIDQLQAEGEKWLEKQMSLPLESLKALKSSDALNSEEEEVFDRLWWNDEHKKALQRFS